MNHADQHWLYSVVYDDLGWCGCGMPEAALALVGKVLDLHPLYDHRDELRALLPDEAVRFFVLYVIDNAELTEHGGNVESGWLTEKGQRFQLLLHDFEALSEADRDAILAAGFSCSSCDPALQRPPRSH